MQDSIAKEKKWGKKMSGNFAIKGGGGGGRLMANAILNFHFDFPHPSLSDKTRGRAVFYCDFKLQAQCKDGISLILCL